MSLRKDTLLLCLSVFLNAALVAGEVLTPDELVRRLASDDFDQRLEAAEKLQALGEKARAVLLEARRSEDPEVRSTAERLLSRLKAARLAIQVVDEDGRPCPKLPLRCRLNPVGLDQGQLWQQAEMAGIEKVNKEASESDEAGVVRVDSIVSGPHSVGLSAGQQARMAHLAHAPWYPGIMLLQSGENRMFWVHPHGATIKGQVVSAKTGEPVANAEVLVRRDDGAGLAWILKYWPAETMSMPLKLCSTDEKGHFTMDRVSAASMRVFVRHADYVPVEGPATLVIRNGEYVLDQPIRLECRAAAWGRIRVQVLNADGKPARGAEALLQLTPAGSADEDALEETVAVWPPRVRNGPLKANEDGWVETELMEPGAYHLRIQACDERPETEKNRLVRIDHGVVQVKAGETVSIAGKAVVKDGSVRCPVRGAVQSANGQEMEIRVFALREDDPAVRCWLNGDPSIRAERLVKLLCRKPDGRCNSGNGRDLVLHNLIPGRYVLAFHSVSANRVGWVFGVEVKAGEQTTTAEVDLTDPGASEDETPSRMLSGIILGDDGMPVKESVNCTLRSRFCSTSTDVKARFQIDIGRNVGAYALIFSCAGYHPFVLDLRKPVENPGDMVVQLERAKYASLSVKVCDSDGKPLEDARVMPISTKGKMPSLERAVSTGADGRAILRGLAIGPRQITAVLDGYSLAEPVQVDLAAEQNGEVTLKMQAGRVVSGRVVLPDGLDPKDVLVWINSGQWLNRYGQLEEGWRNTGVDGQGRFSFSGMPAGPLKLRAQAFGLLSQETVVEAGGAVEPELKLVKPVNVLVDLGPSGRGGLLALVKSGAWTTGGQPVGTAYRINTPVDVTGKLVFADVTPGTYDLLYTSVQINDMGRRQTVSRLIAAGVKVGEGDSPTHLNVTWKPGTSGVRFTTGIPRGLQRQLNRLQQTLFLKGVDCSAVVNPHAVSGIIPPESWFSKGTPPEGYAGTGGDLSFSVDGLAPGEYRLYLQTNQYFWPASAPFAPKKPVLLKTIVLKEGETLDLGRINLGNPDAPGDDRGGAVEEVVVIGNDEPLR